MTVDASKLKRRRSLGTPPTEGAPGMEQTDASIQRQENVQPRHPQFVNRVLEVGTSLTTETSLAANPKAVAASLTSFSRPKSEEEGEGVLGPRMTDENELGTVSGPAQGRGGDSSLATRQRVPPPAAEPRVPFTTRVTISTKERLEDACYHLRRKHQDFINEAILIHLEKHGF